MQTDVDTREAELRARLDAPDPTTWRPDEPAENHPQMLIGELAAVEQGTTSWGPRQIAIVKASDGQLWRVWLLHTVLIDEFLRQQPRIGDMLAIGYEGLKQPKVAGKKPYEGYRLVVHREAGATVGWRSTDGHEPQPAVAMQTVPVENGHAPPPAPADVCVECGWRDGNHRAGCPQDAIPF